MGSETPRGLATLMKRLDTMMPGLRLAKRLDGLKHQAMMDLLSAEGVCYRSGYEVVTDI